MIKSPRRTAGSRCRVYPCTGETDGSHYQQAFNTDGTVTWSTNPNAGASPTTNDKTNYDYWTTTDTGYVAGTKGQLQDTYKPGGSCGATRSLCTSYTYDGLARLVTMTDGRGKVTRYTYDKLDRVIQVLVDGATTCTPSAGTCITYTYDAEGNMTRRVDAQGTTDFTYDRLNRQRTVSTPDASVVTYTYNDDGKLTSLATSVAGGATHTVTYTYDTGNQPLRVISSDLSGTGNILLEHSADNDDKSVQFPTSPAVTSNRTYTNAGRPNDITVDASGVTGSAKVLPDTHFSYQKTGDDTNQVQKLTVSGTASTSINRVVTYAYNPYGAFTGADSDSDSGTDYTYTYDGATDVKS